MRTIPVLASILSFLFVAGCGAAPGHEETTPESSQLQPLSDPTA